MQISFLIRFVRLQMGFPVTLKWEILNVPFFPGCRFFQFRLHSLVFKCHACADPEGGGVGGPDPIAGKSQVLSNSIEISIWTPLVNSWTPPRIPGKFWTKKTPNKHKKNQSCFLAVGLGPPPPPSVTKKSGSAHALTIQQLTPWAHPMSEGTIWLCLYLGWIIH